MALCSCQVQKELGRAGDRGDDLSSDLVLMLQPGGHSTLLAEVKKNSMEAVAQRHILELQCFPHGFLEMTHHQGYDTKDDGFSVNNLSCF